MCFEVNVILAYLSFYSSDYNLIKKSFSELKT